MSQSHLHELKTALTNQGWEVVERLRGDVDVRGAATWDIRRDEGDTIVRIDFDGFGPLGEDIPLDQSSGCQVRDHPIHLYFCRINRSRDRWSADLASFVFALDTVS